MARVMRPPWAVRFSHAIHVWLRLHNMTGIELGLVLGMVLSKWSSAYSGISITLTEYYCRIFCFTGIPEADPRTIPPRRHGDGYIIRALTEEEWQAWLSTNGDQYTYRPPDESSITAVQEHPAELELEEQLQHITTSLEELLSRTDDEAANILLRHAASLGKLYRVVSVLALDPEDRQAALKAQRRYSHE